jgi:hypothetical protein
LLYLAGILAPQTAAGISDAAWICFGICAIGVVAALGLLLGGGAHLRRPGLERWQDEGKPALDSPALLAAVRSPVRRSEDAGPLRPDLLGARELGDSLCAALTSSAVRSI